MAFRCKCGHGIPEELIAQAVKEQYVQAEFDNGGRRITWSKLTCSDIIRYCAMCHPGVIPLCPVPDSMRTTDHMEGMDYREVMSVDSAQPIITVEHPSAVLWEGWREPQEFPEVPALLVVDGIARLYKASIMRTPIFMHIIPAELEAVARYSDVILSK